MPSNSTFFLSSLLCAYYHYGMLWLLVKEAVVTLGFDASRLSVWLPTAIAVITVSYLLSVGELLLAICCVAHLSTGAFQYVTTALLFSVVLAIICHVVWMTMSPIPQNELEGLHGAFT